MCHYFFTENNPSRAYTRKEATPTLSSIKYHNQEEVDSSIYQ